MIAFPPNYAFDVAPALVIDIIEWCLIRVVALVPSLIIRQVARLKDKGSR